MVTNTWRAAGSIEPTELVLRPIDSAVQQGLMASSSAKAPALRSARLAEKETQRQCWTYENAISALERNLCTDIAHGIVRG